MYKFRRRFFRYPGMIVIAAIVVPALMIKLGLHLYSGFSKPPSDKIDALAEPVSGFALEGRTERLSLPNVLNNSRVQTLDIRKVLQSGIGWIRVNGKTYRSTYPSSGILHRPEFDAVNNIVISEQYSSRFDVEWTNVSTTSVIDKSTGTTIAKRVHWSSDTEPHPANEPGTSLEFVMEALGVPSLNSRPLDRVPVKIRADTSPEQRAASVLFHKHGVQIVGCGDLIRVSNEWPTRKVIGAGWEFLTPHVVGSVFCQDNDLFIVDAQTPFYQNGVGLEWRKSSGDFVGRFSIRLSRSESRYGPAAVQFVRLEGSTLRLLLRSGLPEPEEAGSMTHRYFPVMDTLVEIDISEATFDRPLAVSVHH